MNPIVYFYPTGHEKHASPRNPERPERVEAIVQRLDKAGIWQPYSKLLPLQVPEKVLLGVHTRRLLDQLKTQASRHGMIDADTYTTPETWELVQKAAGGAVSTASAVWQGSAKRGFALCRPPGHHATPDQAMGFCLVNNVAVAAEYLLQEMGARKLAIVDIDLHHGNGTQDIFYNRGDVFFVSTHQHPLYPGTGYAEQTGRGDGARATLNVQLPPYSGDAAFASAMKEVILPLLESYGPEMLLVSAGMDAHWRDPLGHLSLTASGYHGLVANLVEFADLFCSGRIALFLEGGYDLDGGSLCALGAASALLEIPFTDTIGESPYEEAGDWKSNIEKLKEIWGLQE